MPRSNGKQPFGDQRQQIIDALAAYGKKHPKAKIDVQEPDWYSVRIRIIDPDFNGLDRVERDNKIWNLLDRLPEEVRMNITLVLLLTPKETKTSLANFEFENPVMAEN